MNTNLFGTDGIRALVGTAPFTLHDMPRMGYAIAQWAEQTYGKNPCILLARDTRISGEWISHGLKTGLLLSSTSVYDADILPTPAALQLMQMNHDFDCAIIISASHNPFQHNGIKILDRVTAKLTLEQELLISHFFVTQANPTHSEFGKHNPYPHALTAYHDAVTKLFEPNFLQGKKIVLDSAHGATSVIAPHIFETLGAEIIAINNTPDGTNINDHCGSVYPESLQNMVLAHNAHVGFGFDGDGDRLTVVGPDGSIKDGDDVLALLIQHPLYRHEKYVVGTIVSNQGLDVFLRDHQKELVRVNVGDKHIVEYLKKHTLLLGGEPSGHTIMRDYLSTGDGIATALRVMETILLTNNLTLETFARYPQILINLPVVHKKNLFDPSIASIITHYESQLDSGRLVVRYSGTENVLRIMVEDKYESTAQAVSTQLACALEKELSS